MVFLASVTAKLCLLKRETCWSFDRVLGGVCCEVRSLVRVSLYVVPKSMCDGMTLGSPWETADNDYRKG